MMPPFATTRLPSPPLPTPSLSQAPTYRTLASPRLPPTPRFVHADVYVNVSMDSWGGGMHGCIVWLREGTALPNI